MTDRTTQLTQAGAEHLLLDTSPYLSCDDCFRLMDAYVEQKLAHPDHSDPRMDAHIRGCGVCADEVAALTELLTDAAPTSGTQD